MKWMLIKWRKTSIQTQFVFTHLIQTTLMETLILFMLLAQFVKRKIFQSTSICVWAVSWYLSWIRKKTVKKLSNFQMELLLCLSIHTNTDSHRRVLQSVCFQTKNTETVTCSQQFTGQVDFTVLQDSLVADQEHQLQPVGSVWWKWENKATAKTQSKFKMVIFGDNSATIFLAT